MSWLAARRLDADARVIAALHAAHRQNHPTVTPRAVAEIARLRRRRTAGALARLIGDGLVTVVPYPVTGAATFKLTRPPSPAWYPHGDCPCGAWRLALERHDVVCPEYRDTP